jgi:hypothetical protein
MLITIDFFVNKITEELKSTIESVRKSYPYYTLSFRRDINTFGQHTKEKYLAYRGAIEQLNLCNDVSRMFYWFSGVFFDEKINRTSKFTIKIMDEDGNYLYEAGNEARKVEGTLNLQILLDAYFNMLKNNNLIILENEIDKTKEYIIPDLIKEFDAPDALEHPSEYIPKKILAHLPNLNDFYC